MLTVTNDQRSALCCAAALKWLPEPDALEYAWNPDTVCAIVDDGELAGPLARLLAGRGWKVAVVTLDLSDPSGWASVLASLGQVAAFIDLHRAVEDSGTDPLWNQAEEARVRASFLMARYLTPILTAPGGMRAWYAVVTRVDGQLGLSAAHKTRGIVTAGVAALAKTLAQEWPHVSCRAIDLDPAMDQDTAVRLVAAELLDPDRTIVEVGHGLAGRCTIAASAAVTRG